MPAPPAERKLVAVAGFENKSTWPADRLWDTSGRLLTAHLLRSGYFRVVAWEEMKRLFDWDVLRQVDIVKSPENIQKAGRILLSEYFISGTITRFNVHVHLQGSAMPDARTIDTRVSVNLALWNARTGRHLATGQGEHVLRQTVAGDQSGAWDSSAGNEALDMATGKALVKLISTFSQTNAHFRPGGFL